jgi:uncharacterized protein YdbL (DUF1318 family)
MTRLLQVLILALGLALPLGGAYAQDSALAAAKAQGLVGERPDGLVGVVSPSASAQIRALVDQINVQRQTLYAQVAQRESTTVEVVRLRFGARLVSETPAGQYYMDAGGSWQRR